MASFLYCSPYRCRSSKSKGNLIAIALIVKKNYAICKIIIQSYVAIYPINLELLLILRASTIAIV